jgi:hypothetical protein
MTRLTDADHDLLDAFITRALELHRDGIVSTENALGHIVHVIQAVDERNGEAITYMEAMRSMLDDAWNDPDA